MGEIIQGSFPPAASEGGSFDPDGGVTAESYTRYTAQAYRNAFETWQPANPKEFFDSIRDPSITDDQHLEAIRLGMSLPGAGSAESFAKGEYRPWRDPRAPDPSEPPLTEID